MLFLSSDPEPQMIRIAYSCSSFKLIGYWHFVLAIGHIMLNLQGSNI